MKKHELKNLQLKKKVVSKLTENNLKGGLTNRCLPTGGCGVTVADCPPPFTRDNASHCICI